MPTYDRPSGFYTTSIPRGTTALRRAITHWWQLDRTEVVRDRDRCQHTRSEHCECRAVDFFTGDSWGSTSEWGRNVGRAIFNFLIAHANILGIQSVIYNRRMWGFGTWKERHYHGTSPHYDHVHVGLNENGAFNLKRETVDQLLVQYFEKESHMSTRKDVPANNTPGGFPHTESGTTTGYYLLDSTGGVHTFGDAKLFADADGNVNIKVKSD